MGRKAMILAAGEGTRLLPLTKEIPKALVAFHGIPMLEILMRRLIDAGFNELIINVYHFKEQIIKFVNDNRGFGAEVSFSEEEVLLDTGGGIKHALSLLGDGPVLFHNVDVLTDIDLGQFYDDHLNRGGKASLVTKQRQSSRYLLFDKSDRLAGWHNPEKRIKIVSRGGKSGFYETAFSGIYILDPGIYELFPEDEVFSLTPWIIELSGSQDIYSWDQGENYWADLGTAANLAKAEKQLIPDPEKPYSFIKR